MTDRMTVAREALTKAAAAFRDYEAQHRAKTVDGRLSAEDTAKTMEKAQRNAALATEMEMALNLLVAQ